jgi:hypothetical protein
LILGYASARASATSAGLDACRLLIASRSSSITDAEREKLGESAFTKLLELRIRHRSLRKVFERKHPSLSPIVSWCRGRYTEKQLHRIPTDELLQQYG